MQSICDAPIPSEAQELTVRLLARACDRAGLSTAYGHCSMRIDREQFLVCAARPMGLVRPQEKGTPVPLNGEFPQGVLGEVRIHREIYRRRQDVGSVIRFISPSITALAALGLSPRPRHGMGAYFFSEVPFWKDIHLVRNDDAAAGVADCLGDSSALFLSINGAVVAGRTPTQALALAVFLEDAARVELAAQSCGFSNGPILSAQDAESRAVWNGNVAERLWDYLTNGDAEKSMHIASLDKSGSIHP